MFSSCFSARVTNYGKPKPNKIKISREWKYTVFAAERDARRPQNEFKVTSIECYQTGEAFAFESRFFLQLALLQGILIFCKLTSAKHDTRALDGQYECELIPRVRCSWRRGNTKTEKHAEEWKHDSRGAGATYATENQTKSVLRPNESGGGSRPGAEIWMPARMTGSSWSVDRETRIC